MRNVVSRTTWCLAFLLILPGRVSINSIGDGLVHILKSALKLIQAGILPMEILTLETISGEDKQLTAHLQMEPRGNVLSIPFPSWVMSLNAWSTLMSDTSKRWWPIVNNPVREFSQPFSEQKCYDDGKAQDVQDPCMALEMWEAQCALLYGGYVAVNRKFSRAQLSPWVCLGQIGNFAETGSCCCQYLLI